MATLSPAPNIWTLNYDPFNGTCWQNRATQELYFVPPGPPPTLSPRSLANCVRQNFVISLPVTPASTVHPPQGFGGLVHRNNNNLALRVPEAAREGSVSFVGCPQPNPSSSILTEDRNQCLPPWSMPNEPRRYYPNDPYPTPAVTARTQASPLQASGTGINFNTNSALEEPKDAKLRPAPLVENMGSYPRLPMSGREYSTRGLPPTSTANAPLPSLPFEPHLTESADDHTKASLVLRGKEAGQFDPSALKRTETARLRPKAIAEDKKPHPSLPVARVEYSKHGSSANSLSNAPRSNIFNGKTLIRGNGGREQFDNDSVLGVPEPIRLRPESIAEDKKPHPYLQTARVGNAKHRLSAKSLSNAPRSNISTARPFTSSAATRGDKASLTRFNKHSTLKVPMGVEGRPESISQNTKPHSSHLVSTADDTKHGFSLKMSSNASRLNIIKDPPLNASARAEASLFRGGDEEGQFDNNSAFEIPVASLEWIAGTNPRSSASMSRAKEAKQWSRTRDNQGKEYYFNITTGQSQSKKPDCLKKYTYRR